MRALLYAIVIAVIATVLILNDTKAAPNWAGDGFAYSIRMQMDRGIPYARARETSRAFYRDKPVMENAQVRRSIAGAYPEYWRLFQPRMLYPWLASLLWQRLGMNALLAVSNLAYVTAVLSVFLLLLPYARAEIAALVTLGFAIFPLARLFGRAALTDMLALVLWTLILLAMCRFATTGKRGWLPIFVLAASALTVTRPLAYMPLCAAAGFGLWAWSRRDRPRLRAAAFFLVVSLALCAVTVVLAQRAEAPSFVAVLEHLRVGSRLLPHAPLAQWYAVRALAALAAGIIGFLTYVVPAVGVAMLWFVRKRPDGAIFLGGIASAVLTAALNPIVSDAPRVIVFPMLPIAAAGLALAAESILGKRSFT